ncbi:hypothetical protein C2845_PM05G20170 [Panicum miliaceum]|uniref:D-isomer specific 2-hydroxyacid dehydrogenase NAD-binding domain-containing protein n=1 Tax=Panicum miliaceum TaxID=4540 RepID=A0A3L6T0L6_PANMI|nr:hypothetical protein C2845_PM05G20170 [Panicum miliaceum]
MKIIMQNGVGLEGVDIGAATEHKIKVARIPGCTTGNAVACAEMAIYLTLGVLRKQRKMETPTDLGKEKERASSGGCQLEKQRESLSCWPAGGGDCAVLICSKEQQKGDGMELPPPPPPLCDAEPRRAGALRQHPHLGELELVDLSGNDFNGSLPSVFGRSRLRLLNASVAKEEDQWEGRGRPGPILAGVGGGELTDERIGGGGIRTGRRDGKRREELPTYEWVLFKVMDRAVNQRELGTPAGETIYGRTIFVLGFGAIGYELAKRLRVFGVKILATKRNWSSNTLPCDTEVLVDKKGGLEDMYEFAGEADIVITCMALTNETIGIVDNKFLAAMKKGSYLVNIARGRLLDYKAVLSHLESGHLSGLGIDVAWMEPFDPEDPILKFSNVIITPHVAGITEYSLRTTAKIVGDVALQLHSGEPFTGIEIVN